jgi:hypothetical protein
VPQGEDSLVEALSTEFFGKRWNGTKEIESQRLQTTETLVPQTH